MNKPTTVDEYIAAYPKNVQVLLNNIRKTIQEAVPDAEESIRYGMPAYRLEGPLVYFGAHTKHIGVYPTPAGTARFAKELSHYTSGKGSVQFPLTTPIPYALIQKLVLFNAQENRKTAKSK